MQEIKMARFRGNWNKNVSYVSSSSSKRRQWKAKQCIVSAVKDLGSIDALEAKGWLQEDGKAVFDHDSQGEKQHEGAIESGQM